MSDVDLPPGIDTSKPHSARMNALPPGSYVTASHVTSEFAPATVGAGRVYTRGGVDVIGRDHDRFADLVFSGLTLVPRM